MVSGLFVSMLLAFGSGLASHVPGEGGNIMTPMEYVERNVSGYLKDWINTYRAEDGKVNGYQVDLPSFLYSHWCNDNEPEDMSCSITEDCAVPSHSKLKGERDNDDYVEFLPGVSVRSYVGGKG